MLGLWLWWDIVSDSFDIIFVSIVDKTILNIKNNNIHDKHKDKMPLYYLSQLFSDTLPDIKFRNTSTQKIEKNYYFLNTKIQMVMMKY